MAAPAHQRMSYRQSLIFFHSDSCTMEDLERKLIPSDLTPQEVVFIFDTSCMNFVRNKGKLTKLFSRETKWGARSLFHS